MTRELILTQMAKNIMRMPGNYFYNFNFAYLEATYYSVQQKAVIL